MSAEVLRRAAALMRERAEAASPSPWGDNAYSSIFSVPMGQAHEEFWNEDRENDGHTYDHRVGLICLACGERPAIYGEGAKAEFVGRRFGTYWDCAFHKGAYDVDPCVAYVPAQYGDTATGRHRADAEHIASWHPAVALDVAAMLDEYARVWELAHETDTDMALSPIGRHVLAVARAYLGESA